MCLCCLYLIKFCKMHNPRHPKNLLIRYLDPQNLPKTPNLRRYDWIFRVTTYLKIMILTVSLCSFNIFQKDMSGKTSYCRKTCLFLAEASQAESSSHPKIGPPQHPKKNPENIEADTFEKTSGFKRRFFVFLGNP